jgi:drug/metabolite transporter (DMT)-like permease
MGLFLKKKITPIMWCCVAASAVGLYLLCIPASGFGSVNVGDIIILACAICFAIHILVIDHFSPKVDGVKLSCIQFFVAGIVSLIIMPFADPAIGFDLPSVADVCASWFNILYAGIMSCGVAYTLQVLGQKETEPTIASMILCLESVFALVAGMLLLGEMMSIREIIGCVIMFAAIVVANLPQDSLRISRS